MAIHSVTIDPDAAYLAAVNSKVCNYFRLVSPGIESIFPLKDFIFPLSYNINYYVLG